ncbi:MAG: peptide-methionine (S)-S-oxide reductase MsrA [Nitrospiria bacterium]
MTTSNHTNKATLAGGCFWCLEPIFSELKGVLGVICGYAGGNNPNPTYQQVCGGRTGHAEVIQITFDPKLISYRDILRVFFLIHNPTTLNRQGADTGTQYRSAIFFHDDLQKTIAEQVLSEVTDEKIWGSPIVTELTPLEAFYKAEDYHQEYYNKNPSQPYCLAVIAPKINKFRQKYFDKL